MSFKQFLLEAYKDERRCTGITINAIAKHHGIKGIDKGESSPLYGSGVVSHLTKHGLKMKMQFDQLGKTVNKYVKDNPTGTHYISTTGHAMALVNGKLHDGANKGPDRRKVQIAASFHKSEN